MEPVKRSKNAEASGGNHKEKLKFVYVPFWNEAPDLVNLPVYE